MFRSFALKQATNPIRFFTREKDRGGQFLAADPAESVTARIEDRVTFGTAKHWPRRRNLPNQVRRQEGPMRFQAADIELDCTHVQLPEKHGRCREGWLQLEEGFPRVARQAGN